MHLTLTIEAEHPGELAPFLAHFNSKPAAIKEVEPDDAPVEEEPEAPAPKKSRSRKAPTAGTAEPSSTEESRADSKSAATIAEKSTAPEKVTFEDLRAAAGPIMDRGDSRKIQEMLLAKFDVRAFGALKEEQYPAALAELQNLG
jgi:hypothetical protein